jgi:hypothetical protein
MRTERQKDIQRYMTTPMAALRNFAKAPKITNIQKCDE